MYFVKEYLTGIWLKFWKYSNDNLQKKLKSKELYKWKYQKNLQLCTFFGNIFLVSWTWACVKSLTNSTPDPVGQIFLTVLRLMEQCTCLRPPHFTCPSPVLSHHHFLSHFCGEEYIQSFWRNAVSHVWEILHLPSPPSFHKSFSFAPPGLSYHNFCQTIENLPTVFVFLTIWLQYCCDTSPNVFLEKYSLPLKKR